MIKENTVNAAFGATLARTRTLPNFYSHCDVEILMWSLILGEPTKVKERITCMFGEENFIKDQSSENNVGSVQITQKIHHVFIIPPLVD